MSTGAQKINHLGFMASVTLHKLWTTSTAQPQSCRLKLCQLLQPYKTITNNS